MFSDLRIVVPLPPENWFGGHDLELAKAGISVFRDLGATVETLSAEEWDNPDNRPELISRLRHFAANFAVGIPNAGYGLYFTDGDPADGDVRNLFTEILSIPLVLLWDHLLTQAPNYFLRDRFFESPVRPGALQHLSQKLENILNRHYVPDTGHVEVYETLGIISSEQTRPYLPCAMDHFVEFGNERIESSIKNRVGFAGNIYSPKSSRLEILNLPLIRSIDDAILRAKHVHWGESAWNLLCQAIDQLPSELVYDAGLTPDYPFFWRIAFDLLSLRISTTYRLDVLGAITYPVDFYGNFADPDSRDLLVQNEINYCGNVDYKDKLPSVFAAYDVWVDVTNAPFIRGCGAKLFNCFAAGSLMLVDYCEDLRDNVGELSESFMFRDADDLNQKIDFYLTHPKERAVVIDDMQRLIHKRLSWRHLSAQLCIDIAGRQ